MNRVFAVALSLNVRSVFSEIISNQIDSIRKRKTVDLSLNTDSAENDSPLVVEIKKQLKASQDASVARLGTIGAELINSSTQTSESLVAEARALRKEANEKLAKARNLHNAQQHMLNTGDSLPLALYLDMIPAPHISLVEKHINQAEIKDYFGEKNPKKSSD